MALRPSGGASVLVPIVGQKLTLLIRESNKPSPRVWKPVSETFDEGDTLLDAIVRGLKNEVGWVDLQSEVGSDGHVAQVTDPRVRLMPVMPPATMENEHLKHFWGVWTNDAQIAALSGKEFTSPDGERIRTQSYRFSELDSIPMFQDHKTKIRLMLNQIALAPAC